MHDLPKAGAATAGPATPTVETLDNGLEVLVLEDHSTAVASVQLWCRTGSIHEAEWLGAGLSHFVEHMLFKGTSKLGLGEVARGVQERGGYINAYTSFDRTVYWIDTPSDGAAEAIEVLIDAASDSLMPADEVEKEQEVIRREFAMGNDDRGRVLSKATFANAFRWHPYRQPVIGHLEVFDQLGREELFAYYKKRYVPNNCFLVVAGAVDTDAVLAQARQSSEAWMRSALAPIYIPEEPPQMGRRDRHMEFGSPLHHLSLCWQIPALWHEDIPALDILATVLGDGRSSRLYREVRESQRVAHSVHAYAYTPGSNGLFMVGGDAEPENRAALEKSILAEIQKLQNGSVDPSELEKSTKAALCDHHHTATTMRGQASDLASSWILTQNPGFSNQYVQGLSSVTAEDIQRVASEYLVSEKICSTSLSPIGTLKPKSVKTTRSTPAETTVAELDNGLRVVLRPDRRVPLATAHLNFGGGLLADGHSRAGLSQLLARTLLKGTETRDANSIADSIENVGGSIGASSGNNSFGLSVDLLAADLPMALDIMGDVITQPTFPTTFVEGERESLRASIRSELKEPMTSAFWEMRKHIFGDLPFGMPLLGTDELVSGFQTSDLHDLRSQIAIGSNGVLTVVGAIDQDQVLEQANKAFGQLPTGSPFLESLDLAPPKPLGGIHQLERDKEQAVLVVAYPGIDLRSPDRHAADLVDACCSDMASRLFTRIREELGLCYYIGAGQVRGYTPGMFYFYVGTSAEQIDLVQAEILDEIAKLSADGLSSEELERARNSMLGRREIGLQAPGSIGQIMALDTLYGMGPEHHREIPDLLRAVSRDDCQSICAKLFGTVDPTIVRVLPSS